MILDLRNWRCAAILVAVFCGACPARATIDYTVSLSHPERHIFGVTMRIPKVRDQVTLQMPAWDALYQIRDFSSHMMQVTARDEEGHPLPLRLVDKQTWSLAGNGTVTVSYPILWDEPGPFATQLNPDHAFLNFAMLLLYVPDRRSEDTRVAFDDMPDGWRVAVELDTVKLPADHRSDSYFAPSYDALVDAPVEIGRFEEWHFEAGGRPIRVVVHGDAGDRSRLTDSLKRIVDYEASLMAGAPFREYLFLFHVGNNFGGGGMEHMNCTAIAVSREMWTRSLWFAEGVTSTYGSYALLRTGLWNTQQFYDNLAEEIRELQSRPAHRWQSVEQSSLDAWYEKYPMYTLAEESISYYNKGQIDGVLLDILIRDRTDNRGSLDDVLRSLNEEYAKQGRFYNDSEGLRAAMENVIRKKDPTADAGLDDFFKRYISGTDEIPYADFLSRAGWTLRDTSQRRATLGFSISRGTGNSPSIISVDRESSAGESGLNEGDVLISLNGDPFPRSPDRWLRDHQPDEHVTVRIRRNGAERDYSFPLGRQTEAVYQISDAPAATEKQRRIRDGILRGVTNP
jgi:predicted metalloprotease with PDZ domain